MYDARTRNRFRAAATLLTGVATVATATAAGLVTGLAARSTEAQKAPETTAPTGSAGARPTQPRRTVVRWKKRPVRTVVETHTIYRTVSPAGVGGGSVGTLPASPPSVGSTSWSGSGSSGGGGGASGGGGSGSGSSGSHPAPAPPPPPPPPPPAPTSGS